MLKIKLDYVDELLALSRKLCAVTYLQALVHQDESDGSPLATFDFINEYSYDFLYDLQEDLVLKLRKLVEKDDFAINGRNGT